MGFADADAFHSAENKAKMAEGTPLTDADRLPWLFAMRDAIIAWLREEDAHVLACSALKERYREILQVGDEVAFVYLRASADVVRQRLASRTDHYMKANMVESQFAALEEPGAAEAIVADASLPPRDIIEFIKQQLRSRYAANR